MSNSKTRDEQSPPLPAGQSFEREGPSARRRRLGAFTLIELLVVISIIGVLASLVVGLTGLATRKSKESRIRTELTKLASQIENYKSALGFYPPDHPGFPSTNQLFFELSGTEYRNNQFYVAGRLEPISPTAVQTVFGTAGFGNSARVEKDLKYNTEFKSSQFKRISANPPIDVLVVPVKGRKYGTAGSWTLKTINGEEVNPWLYVSTSPTNNADRFDLWTEVVIGSKVIRFSNWEKDPVVLTP